MSVHTMILAEPGSTAEGDLDTFFRLVDVAAECGADVFKNQWLSSAERLCRQRNASEYLWSYRKLEFPLEWHEQIARRCEAAGIAYACSTYLRGDASLVAPWATLLKIASFESSDQLFITQHHDLKRPIIVSTGMASEVEIAALATCLRPGDVIMHCVSSYPTPDEEINIGAVHSLLHIWPAVGLSDHTKNSITGALAIAAGATWLERHYRLDDTDPANADYEVASSPALFKEYVRLARLAEQMVGTGMKRAMPCEEPMLKYRVRP